MCPGRPDPRPAAPAAATNELVARTVMAEPETDSRSRASPRLLVRTGEPREPRTPISVSKVTAMPWTSCPKSSRAVASRSTLPPVFGIVAGVPTRVNEKAKEPMATSTEASLAPPELATTVAVPTRPSPRSVVSATPPSSVGTTFSDRTPRVVVNVTSVPGFTREPSALRSSAPMVVCPAFSIRSGEALSVMEAPVGATGVALSQAGETRTARRTRRNQGERI